MMMARQTKARTVGQKKRGRPRKDGPREDNGRPSRVSPKRREETQQTVIVARCKIMGWLPRIGENGLPTMAPTADMTKRAASEWMGCNAGRAIEGEAPDVRAELWAAIKHVATTYARYWASIGAPPPYASAAMMTYLPEIMGSDGVEASTWDHRTEEERVRASSAAMMRLEQTLGMAGEGVAVEVKGVVLHDAPVRNYARMVLGLRAVLE
jgi:hypothetical protein